MGSFQCVECGDDCDDEDGLCDGCQAEQDAVDDEEEDEE